MSTWNKQRPVPGPQSKRLAARLKNVESPNVTYLGDEFPIFWESASGSIVQDVDGNSYLDLTSAFGVASLGHTPSALKKAIRTQSQKMWHGMGDVHPNEVKVELLEALRRATGGRFQRAILSSSGAEAVESALKTARLATGKRGVIAFDGAYHGLTYGTLGVTDRSDFREPFRDQLPSWCTHLPYPDLLHGRTEEQCLEILERFLKTGHHPAGPFGAIIVEAIQGRGGVRIAGSTFLKGLRELSTHYGLVLIVDEVFTGIGRTGKFLAIEHSGIVPDLICVGKALTNGYPLSACLGTEAVMNAWPPSDGEAIHTSTFLGNPLGCAMALATLKELESKKLIDRAARLGKRWLHFLKDVLGSHPQVAEIRGEGMMMGIELVKDKNTLEPNAALASHTVKEALKQGLIVLSGGSERNVLTLTPPLSIKEQDLKKATSILNSVFQKWTPHDDREPASTH